MKVLSALCVAPLMLIACGDDSNGNGSDATSNTNTTDTSNNNDVGPGVSPITGVNTNVTVTAPTPNAGCDLSEVDNTNHGARYPWGGWTEGSTVYTCNRCPGGRADMQGEFRAFEYDDNDENQDYSSPDPSDQAEALRIDGNTWEVTAFDSTQSPNHVVARGYYFCAQQPEHPNEHIGWVILEANPTGGLGYTPNSGFGSDVPTTANGEVLLDFQDSVNGTNQSGGFVRRFYCPFGQKDPQGVECTDPLP